MVDLVSGALKYSGAIDLPQYYVKNTTVFDKFRASDTEFGVKVEVVLGRRLLNQLLTTFMPSTFICLVAISTNFFRVRISSCYLLSVITDHASAAHCRWLHLQPSHYECIVTVNVTLLLVLSALFISVLDSMPRTSYVKMIDVWLISCLTIPLAEVLFHLVVDKYRDDLTKDLELVDKCQM